MAAPHGDAVEEDHRHRVLEHREAERAEEQHRAPAAASRSSRWWVEEDRRVRRRSACDWPGTQPLEVAAERLQQLAPGRPSATARSPSGSAAARSTAARSRRPRPRAAGPGCAEPAQDPQSESTWMGKHMGRSRAEDTHAAQYQAVGPPPGCDVTAGMLRRRSPPPSRRARAARTSGSCRSTSSAARRTRRAGAP